MTSIDYYQSVKIAPGIGVVVTCRSRSRRIIGNIPGFERVDEAERQHENGGDGLTVFYTQCITTFYGKLNAPAELHESLLELAETNPQAEISVLVE